MDSLLWLVLIVVFLMAEAGTVTLISLWFAAGALVAMIASLLGAQFWLQGVLFFVVACFLLACLRPLVRKYIKPRITKTNVDAIIGAKGYVTAAVDNLSATGKVRLGGMEWTARSASGQRIAEGTLVKVDRIEGVKAFVTPVNE